MQDAAEATKIFHYGNALPRGSRHHFQGRHSLGFIKQSTSSHARLNVPTLVQVAAMAIILIRGLDVLMIMNTLGIRGMGEFIHRSVQTWSFNPGLSGQLSAGLC
ncbi:membrane protein [Salmonella enterica subsp. enterica]|uniref:Membrane protein n=1 Tax=Salmonella enterica I TaxID=59201 RepID=A0A3S4JGV6_SALET|nr:membrane protein [Salmonella enterica subsp. enterica]